MVVRLSPLRTDIYIYICIYVDRYVLLLLYGCGPTPAMVSPFTRFIDHTQRPTTVGRTHLDEWSARRTDLYLTTHNTHNRQTSMLPPPPVGFEPAASADERPQTYSLARAVTGIGICISAHKSFNYHFNSSHCIASGIIVLWKGLGRNQLWRKIYVLSTPDVIAISILAQTHIIQSKIWRRTRDLAYCDVRWIALRSGRNRVLEWLMQWTVGHLPAHWVVSESVRAILSGDVVRVTQLLGERRGTLLGAG